MSIARCPHGYFTHSQFNRCPWCFGVDKYNKDAVPMRNGAPGNGWLLKRGQHPCNGCGGPATAGYGLRPEGLTDAQYADVMSKIRYCYTCAVSGR